ncbi:hypothetical protein BUALT_Bualt18G0093900 [Buddleja alternifolia]|uniref:Pollen Ole e 1 allergen and extensin family protein n=1 Tax=Buddleja alternifolia TaxID=168488 RepID=A0AAV6W5K2_9LAMI|nr:hypothetical protein BUALT_Bualt18G0093900 [Buddleja alternifolia]
MRISRFLGHNALVNMIFFVFIIFVLQTPAVANGNEDKLAELSSKEEELVRWASYGEEKLSTVVISGKLLCHSAAKDKLSSHPHPVSGASVAVFCGTSGRKKKSWARGSTSSYGEFLIDLPSHLHAIPNLEKICLVKVLHLPKSSPCRRAFTGKHKAIKLTSIGEGVRIYTTQKIHLLPKPSQEHMRQGGKTEQAISIL